MTKSEFNTTKKAYKSVVIDKIKNDYVDFEISDGKINELYNEITNSELKIADEDSNLYYTFLYACKKKIENYLMKECKNENLLYQIMLAEKLEYIVIRYLSLKKKNNFKSNANDISYSILENLILEYNKDESLENQYVKRLKQKFSK